MTNRSPERRCDVRAVAVVMLYWGVVMLTLLFGVVLLAAATLFVTPSASALTAVGTPDALVGTQVERGPRVRPHCTVFRYGQPMRCLLIAPTSMDVHVLSGVLMDQGVEVLSAPELGAGVTLAQAAVDLADCAVAVLPSQPTRTAEGLAAIFIEIGIVVGRGIPIMVIVEPPEEPPPALAGATIVRTQVNHVDALRLHLRMFMLTVAAGGTVPQPAPRVALEPSSLAGFRERLEAISNPPRVHGASSGEDASTRPMQLERLVHDILSAAGAVTATDVELSSDTRREADVVAYVPGTESVLGAIIVEVKLRRLTEVDLQSAERQLLANMKAGRVGFGLLVHNGLAADAHKVRAAPFMLALSIDELLSELEYAPLGELLVRARNRAVHGA